MNNEINENLERKIKRLTMLLFYAIVTIEDKLNNGDSIIGTDLEYDVPITEKEYREIME